MKALFIAICLLTATYWLFAGGCSLMVLDLNTHSKASPVSFLFGAAFVPVVVANGLFIYLAQSQMPKRGRFLKNSALIFAALFAVCVLAAAKTNASDPILNGILVTVSGFTAAQIIFAYLLGVKMERDDQRAAAHMPTPPGEQTS